MARTCVFLAGALLLAGCAMPKVVDERQASDGRLTCGQLEAEIARAGKYEREAHDARDMTVTNVAAALFFWPGLLATAVNTDKAIDAAKVRQDHLQGIYWERGC